MFLIEEGGSMNNLIKTLFFVLVSLMIFSQLPVMTQAADAPECVIVDADGLMEKEYMTFGEALDAVKDRETIRLLQNVNYSKSSKDPAINIEYKTVTFDVGEFTLNVSNSPGIGLRIGKGGKVLLEYEGKGEFNVFAYGNFFERGVCAVDGGMATVTNVSAEGYGTIAVSAESVNEENGISVIEVLGNVTAANGSQYAVIVSLGGQVDVYGDVVVSTSGIYAGTVSCYEGKATVNNIIASGDSVVGPNSNYGGEVTVRGSVSITASFWATGASATSEGKVVVMGDITAACEKYNAEGVRAFYGGEIIVLGNIYSKSTEAQAYGIQTYGQQKNEWDWNNITMGGRVKVSGNVTVISGLEDESASVGVYTEAYNSAEDSGGLVTVEGRITAKRYVICRVYYEESKVFLPEDGAPGTGEYKGYWNYNDGYSTVRVRGLTIESDSLPDAIVGKDYRIPIITYYQSIFTSPDALIFNIEGQPEGLFIDEIGVISGTPANSSHICAPVDGKHTHTPYSVKVEVTDGKLMAEKVMMLAVNIESDTDYTVTFKSNGTVYDTRTVDACECIGAEWPLNPVRAGYVFGGWFTDENGAGTNFTDATVVNTDITVYAKWKRRQVDNSSDTPISTPEAPVANFKTENGNEIALPVLIDIKTGHSSVDISTDDLIHGQTVLVMPSQSSLKFYSVIIALSQLQATNDQDALTLSTDLGNITVPCNMLTGIEDINGSKAQIILGQGDKNHLPNDIRAGIGNRPFVQLNLYIDGKLAEWNNSGAWVTVSIPYTPTAAELENLDCIVVWYIDGSGRVVTIPNGRYDPQSGRVTFRTNHFSDYTVVYNPVCFNDVFPNAWYEKAVSFIAARCITAGTGNGNYSPDSPLTRGEFIALLLRSYGITADEKPVDNFVDGGDNYFTGYLAAAKRLGISAGVGNNRFAPDRFITRQEMITLMYNTLRVINQLPSRDSSRTLSNFSDASDVAVWAREAMIMMVESGAIVGSGAKLFPTATTTRAEMAQILYKLLSK